MIEKRVAACVNPDAPDFAVEASKVTALMAGVKPIDAAEGMLASLLVLIHHWATDALTKAKASSSVMLRDMQTIQANRMIAQHLAVADMLQRDRIIEGRLAMRPAASNGLSVGVRRSRDSYNAYQAALMARRAKAAKAAKAEAARA